MQGIESYEYRTHFEPRLPQTAILLVSRKPPLHISRRCRARPRSICNLSLPQLSKILLSRTPILRFGSHIVHICSDIIKLIIFVRERVLWYATWHSAVN